MNAKELAEKMGVHYNTIRKKIDKGELKATKKGRSYEIDDEQAFKLIREKKYKLSSNEILFSMDIILNFLREEERECFRFFVQGMDKIAEKYNDAVDQVDELDLNSFWLKDNVIDVLDKGMEEFIVGTKHSGSPKENYEKMKKIKGAIEILEEFKDDIVFRFTMKKQFKEYEEIRKKEFGDEECGLPIEVYLKNI